MKVQYIQDDYQRVGFKATPEDQDSWPKVPFLFTSLAPSMFDGPRKALAGALAHLSHAAGKLSIDGVVSPLTARQIHELANTDQLFLDTNCISFRPTDIQQGSSELHVSVVETLQEADSFVTHVLNDKDSSRTALALVPNDGIQGFLAAPRFRIIPSNLWSLKNLDDERSYFLGLASLALMYSMDLSAGRIVLHQIPELGDRDLGILEHTFYSVGTTLEVRND